MPAIIQHSSVAEYYSSEGSDSSSVTQLRYFNAYALGLFQAEGLQISLTSSEGNDSSKTKNTRYTDDGKLVHIRQSDVSRSVLLQRCHSLGSLYLIVKSSKNFNKGFWRVIYNKQDTVEL